MADIRMTRGMRIMTTGTITTLVMTMITRMAMTTNMIIPVTMITTMVMGTGIKATNTIEAR